jgi:hypothetical protein
MFRRNRIAIAVAVVTAGFFPTGAAFAAPAPATAPTTGPATAPAVAGGAVESMRVVVAEVTGLVQVRENETAKWQKAVVGMELGENAEFRTGPRSTVTCKIPPDQTFIIDRLGVMKVAEAVRSGNQVRTDLIMKYGRTQYAIEAAGAQHESTIRSPSSTLAVRGTVVSLYDQAPFTTEARSFTGRAVFTTAKRQVALGAPGRGARIRAGDGTPAESALNDTVVDPVYAAARTNAEAQYVATEQSRGGVVGFDRRLGITTIRNSPPFTDAELASAKLPGDMNIVLRWTGDADLDLAVLSQVGDPFEILGIPHFTDEQPPDPSTVKGFQPQETHYPGFGLNRALISGGQIAANHRGGPSGGQEIAFYTPAPTGVFTIQANHVSGDPAQTKFNFIVNGQPQGINTPKLGPDGQPITYTLKIDFGDGNITEIPGIPVLEGQIPILNSDGTQAVDNLGNPLFEVPFIPPTQIERTLQPGTSTFFQVTKPATIPQDRPTEGSSAGTTAAQRSGDGVTSKQQAREQRAAARSAARAAKEAREAQAKAAAKAAREQRARDAAAAKQQRAAERADKGVAPAPAAASNLRPGRR